MLLPFFFRWLSGRGSGELPVLPLPELVLVTVKMLCNHIEGLSGLGEFLSERHGAKNGMAEGESELRSNDVKEIEQNNDGDRHADQPE